MRNTTTAARRRTWRTILCTGALLVAPVGCLFDAEVADGGACEVPEDCASGGCIDGFCVGSRCDGPGDDDTCEPGWLCTHIPPSFLDDVGAAIGGVFGGDGDADGHHACLATCGHCPGNQHCGGRADGLCDHGPPLGATGDACQSEMQCASTLACVDGQCAAP